MSLLPLLLFLLFVALPHSLFAQGDTITRNPKCVQLKRIWTLEGRVTSAQVGSSVGSVGDINGDGLGDFAVLSYIPWQWRVFYGNSDTISTTAVWTFDSATSEYPPVAGDFFGTGHNAVGFVVRRFVGPTGTPYWWMHMFRSDSNRLDTTPAFIWPMTSWKDTAQRAFADDLIAADLDNDGDDELIVALRWVGGEGRYGQIWIYEGGPDFQMQVPSIVIKDPELNEDFHRLHVGDIDGDRRVDLMVVKRASGVTKTNFYWSGNGWPKSGRQPDRILDTGDPQNGDYSEFAFLVECDGDGIMDVMTSVARIWRSGSGKDPHVRDWSINDADINLKSAGGPFGPAGRPGYLNSKRYEMVATAWAPGKLFFSGGSNGPDLDYDAIYYPGLDGLQIQAGDPQPVGDVNGDGWDDAISGNSLYPDRWTESGIAIIIAGGPYIPIDEPAVGVRQIALENDTAALSLWPNPVREELNIAWRGDLARMPRRFEIHDMLGRLVSHGSVPDGDGAALWRCGDQPAGAYLLSVFDASGVLLVSERFGKE